MTKQLDLFSPAPPVETAKDVRPSDPEPEAGVAAERPRGNPWCYVHGKGHQSLGYIVKFKNGSEQFYWTCEDGVEILRARDSVREVSPWPPGSRQ